MTEPIYETDLFRIERCPACDEDAEHPVYIIQEKEAGTTIGAVKWNAFIAEYCLYPRPNTAWNWDALFHLLNFLIDEISKQVLDQAKGPAS
jgi:hypothetical protein